MASSTPAPSTRDHATITITGETYTMHRTHWYTDGNLVIPVDKVAFRVFQSFLTRRSPVMESLIAIQQAEDLVRRDPLRRDQETALAGASVLRLDDSAEDVALLLDVVLPQSCATAPISSRTEWFRLIGLAQIAHKYAVTDVLSQVLTILEEVLPTVQHPHRVRSPAEAAIIIYWARKCKFHQFLPLAFYYLVTGEWQFNTVDSRAMELFSARGRLRAQQGQARLQARVIKLAMPRWENCLIGSSKPKQTCPGGRYSCWMGYGGKLWPIGDNEARWTNLLLHPLEELRMRADHEVATLHHFCDSCRNQFTLVNRLMIRDIVEQLGTFFTLEDETTPLGVGL